MNRLRGTIRYGWNRSGDLLLAAACWLLSLALYVHTLAPSVATLFDDSLEFPLVVARLGIAHPTGYPLYILLARLLTLGPWHNVAWAVNLLSALAGATAVALAYLLARQLMRRRWPALLGAAALAASPVFWSQAVVAEVYTLNAVFVAGLLWLALRWAQNPLVPVEPFALLLVEPRAPRSLFLPRQGLWLRLPPAVRRRAHRWHAFYRRFFPAVPARRRLQLNPLAYALALVGGLSQAHHRTALLLLPALLLLALLADRRVFSRAALLGPEHPGHPRWLQVAGRPVVLLAISFLLPLLLYLYLPLRGSTGSLDGTYANTWGGFWRWVTTGGYGAFLGANPLARNLDAAFYVDLFWRQFGPLGLALALIGLIGLVRRPRALALTGLAFVTYVAFAVAYRVPDVEVFAIPAFLIAAVWLAAGLDWALDLLRVRGPSLGLRRFLACCLVLLGLAALAQPALIAVRAYPDLDLSRQWAVHDYGQYVLGQDLPYGNSTVVGLGGEINLLRYFQTTTGLRRDVETVIADDEASRLQAVETALARGRAVYVTRPLPGLVPGHSLDAVTGLIEVDGDLEMLARVDAPEEQVAPLPPGTTIEQVPGLRLLSAAVQEHCTHWQAWARLQLWWRSPRGLDEDLKISARLQEPGGRTISAVDAEPVGGAYPTAAWQRGEIVADAYEIPLPPGTPPGDYTPLVVVYDPATGQERGRVALSPVHLAGNPARPPQRALEASLARTLYARFGEVDLLGFTPPDPAATYRLADQLPLTLLWQVPGAADGDLGLSFWLQAVQDYPLGSEPLGGRLPVGQWAAGQALCQWPALQVPANVPAGAYRLKMRVTRDGVPEPWGRGPIPGGSDLNLGLVQIGP